jgi:hypothetical protein
VIFSQLKVRLIVSFTTGRKIIIILCIGSEMCVVCSLALACMTIPELGNTLDENAVLSMGRN